MKNVSLEKEKIKVDFLNKDLPPTVRNFRPDVYRNGDSYNGQRSGQVDHWNGFYRYEST